MGGTLYQINKSAVITRFSVRMLFKVCFFSRLTGPVCLQSSNFAMIKIYLYFLYTSQTKMKKKNKKPKGLIKKKYIFLYFPRGRVVRGILGEAPKAIVWQHSRVIGNTEAQGRGSHGHTSFQQEQGR